MYEIYQRLLDEKGLKNSDVSRATGVSNMTLSDWKRGISTPKTKNMKKIADFFGVSEEYLRTGKEPHSAFTPESAHLVAKLRNDAELVKALEKYFSMTPDKKKHVIDTINMLSEGK